MNAKKFFEEIIKLDRLINLKLEEVEKLKSLCEMKGSSRSENSGGSGSKGDNSKVLMKYIEAKTNVDAMIDELIDKRLTAFEWLGIISDVKRIDVIYSLYFDHKTVAEVAEKLDVTDQRVYQLRNNAFNEIDLKYFQKL